MQEQQQVWSQEECQVSRHSLFILLYCSQLTWYLLVVVRMLPIPQHGKFKDTPSFVAICTPQGLAVKATCMQDCRRRISPACIGWELLPFQLSTVYLCTTWRLDPKALALLPGFRHCCSLAFCAQGMAAARPRLVVALNIQTLCQTSDLSASSTCLHTCMLTQCQAFQVEHIWSCLVLLIFSSPQASVLNVRNHACRNMHT
jgi:hypothetical protein